MCTNGLGKGASGSSMMIASSTVPAGTPFQLKGGEIFSPTPIPAERSGICFPLRNHSLFREISSGTPKSAAWFEAAWRSPARTPRKYERLWRRQTAKPMRCRGILAQPRFSTNIWNSLGTVELKTMIRTRSNTGKCFRMNAALHVGA